jgi:hypothetical protein
MILCTVYGQLHNFVREFNLMLEVDIDIIKKRHSNITENTVYFYYKDQAVSAI